MSGDRDLAAIEQVRRAKARYCRFVDTKRWGDLAGLFIDNPQIRIFDPDGQSIAEFDTRDAFVTAARILLEGAQSSHHVHNDEIDLVSVTEIAAIWAMEDIIVVRAPRPGQPSRLHGYGHYHECWTLTQEGWRIARLELRRTVLTITNA